MSPLPPFPLRCRHVVRLSCARCACPTSAPHFLPSSGGKPRHMAMLVPSSALCLSRRRPAPRIPTSLRSSPGGGDQPHSHDRSRLRPLPPRVHGRALTSYIVVLARHPLAPLWGCGAPHLRRHHHRLSASTRLSGVRRRPPRWARQVRDLLKGYRGFGMPSQPQPIWLTSAPRQFQSGEGRASRAGFVWRLLLPAADLPRPSTTPHSPAECSPPPSPSPSPSPPLGPASVAQSHRDEHRPSRPHPAIPRRRATGFAPSRCSVSTPFSTMHRWAVCSARCRPPLRSTNGLWVPHCLPFPDFGSPSSAWHCSILALGTPHPLCSPPHSPTLRWRCTPGRRKRRPAALGRPCLESLCPPLATSELHLPFHTPQCVHLHDFLNRLCHGWLCLLRTAVHVRSPFLALRHRAAV